MSHCKFLVPPEQLTRPRCSELVSLSPQNSTCGHGSFKRYLKLLAAAACHTFCLTQSLGTRQPCSSAGFYFLLLQSDFLFLSLLVGLLFIQSPGDSAYCLFCVSMTTLVWSKRKCTKPLSFMSSCPSPLTLLYVIFYSTFYFDLKTGEYDF